MRRRPGLSRNSGSRSRASRPANWTSTTTFYFQSRMADSLHPFFRRVAKVVCPGRRHFIYRFAEQKSYNLTKEITFFLVEGTEKCCLSNRFFWILVDGEKNTRLLRPF